jgi:type IV secretion system protein VirD4
VLNVEAFLRWRGTLYLVGGAGDKRLAPLLTALTEYVFDEAQRIAAQQPGGRLSPTLNFILDEVANTTPVPLDRWASDSRGWGITVGAVVQSLAQFATTWGRDRAEVIWENLPTKIVLPGVSKQEDLRALSYLAGQRWVQRTTRGESEGGDGRASRSTSRTPTLEPVVAGHTISAMPRWHAYVLGLGRHPAIVSYTPGYARVAAAQRAAAAEPARPVTAPPAPDREMGQVMQLPTTRGQTR